MADAEPQAPQPEQTATEPPSVESTKDERTLAMLCHLLALITGFIGPLVLWLIKKDDMPLVDDQGKESLNFQITMIIASVVSALLICVFVGVVLLPVVVIYDIVYIIIAAMKANEGELYRYPICLRLIK